MTVNEYIEERLDRECYSMIPLIDSSIFCSNYKEYLERVIDYCTIRDYQGQQDFRKLARKWSSGVVFNKEYRIQARWFVLKEILKREFKIFTFWITY